MLGDDQTFYTEEQKRTLEHFNERSGYWSEIYQDDSSFAGYVLQKQQHFVLDLIKQIDGIKRILDVGCGAGVTALELAQTGYDVSGVDLASKMIERAQAEARRWQLSCDFRVGLAEQLPYSDGSFDALIALGLLGNILDDQYALREMARILKPGGRFMVTVPNRLALDLWIALPKSLPILLGATRFRHSLRLVGDIGRLLIGRKIKGVSTLRHNQCVIPPLYVRRLQQLGFKNVQYHALAFGPLMPLGVRFINDQTSIQVSEKIARWVERVPALDSLGTLIVYEGQRA